MYLIVRREFKHIRPSFGKICAKLEHQFQLEQQVQSKIQRMNQLDWDLQRKKLLRLVALLVARHSHKLVADDGPWPTSKRMGCLGYQNHDARM